LAVDGKRDWDAEFIQLLPSMVTSKTDLEAASAIVRWLDSLGPVTPCAKCVTDSAMPVPAPTKGWLESDVRDPGLRASLERIYVNRPGSGSQHYVRPAPGVGNALFSNESTGESDQDPAARLLTLARYWNAVRFWFPYRTLIARDWDKVLETYVPQFAAADNGATYAGLLHRFAAELGDGHSRIRPQARSAKPPSAAAPSKPVCIFSIDWRFAGEHLTVHRDAKGILRPGDVILAIDDVPLATMLQRIEQTIRVSTHAHQLERSTNYLLAGECAVARVLFKRGPDILESKLVRIPAVEADPLIGKRSHDRTGPTFQTLPGNVAYLKLSDIQDRDIPDYMNRARSTSGLIVDIRNYPSAFVPFAIGRYFAQSNTPFAKFTKPQFRTPGAFEWANTATINPAPAGERLTIPLVVLIDSQSISQSEYTAMALEAVGAHLVGSTTAGADGNVTMLPLPTGETAIFTGIGVFYPDGRPTQRIGIVPHDFVEPTPAGIAAGRDEVLDAALEFVVQSSGQKPRAKIRPRRLSHQQ
jgi:hypothetical protein